eukprot:SAG25_NODE_266_length_10666_cov_14.508943_12_plen_41_part_00
MDTRMVACAVRPSRNYIMQLSVMCVRIWRPPTPNIAYFLL